MILLAENQKQIPHALGRVLNDAGDADGFCLKKINNISEFSSSKNNHQIIIENSK